MPIELQWEVPATIPGLGAFLTRVAEACFAVEGIEGAGFAVRVVDDATIRQWNHETRGIDRVTDVLSFPTVRYPAGKTARDCPGRLHREYDPSLGYVNLGDCMLNLEQARRQAREYGHSLTRELGYLTAHSAFHLMGYDHEEEEDRRAMRAMEDQAMQKLSLTRENGDDPMTFDELFALACDAMENAYAPYSHFRVGACILTSDGSTFQGCNFENASYPATICAERCAAGSAIAAGQRQFEAIAICGEFTAAWPCGICRQVLREFSDLSLPVIVGQYRKSYTVRTLGELLPESFGPEDLITEPVKGDPA